MSLPAASLSARVGGLFASHFLGFGLFLPFFPLVLEDRGLTVAEIGYILSAGTIVRIAANPVMTGLSDHSGRRRLSIFAYSMAGAAFLGFFIASSGMVTALIAVMGLMIFWSPIVPLSDAYALDVVRNHGADYGRMRLWGSVGFVVANVFGGWLAGMGNSQLIVMGTVLGVISTGFVAISLPRQGRDEETGEPQQNQRPKLFWSPWFLGILGVIGLLQGSHAAFYGFGTLFWLQAGISEFAIGLLWSIGVLAEIALFFVAGRLGLSFGPLTFLLVGAAGGILRWLLFPLADSFVTMAALQLMHGLSFGAAHLGSVAFLSRLVPPKWGATGQGFLAASNGILTALGLAICGPLFELDPAYPFWAMAAVSIVATLGLALLHPFMAKKLAAGDVSPAV
ncbi:MFS transporter [Roseibium polysiphoniae]|uniref:MFS transporter n=1 Tax=Roseibium polysiphoniae TaxID=2571221 RepID=UPI0032975474